MAVYYECLTVRIGSSQEDTNPLFNYTSSLWDENLTQNSSGDMIAGESSPAEIWAEAPAVAEVDDFSGHWSLFQVPFQVLHIKS